MTTGYFEAIPLEDMTASQTQPSMEERIQEIADRLQEVSQTRIKCVLILYNAQKIINLSFQSTKLVQLFYVHVQTQALHSAH